MSQGEAFGLRGAPPGRYGHHRTCTNPDCTGCDTVATDEWWMAELARALEQRKQ